MGEYLIYWTQTEVKWLKCEAEYSFPTRAEVKDKWSYALTPTYAYIFSTGTKLLHFTQMQVTLESVAFYAEFVDQFKPHL